MGGSHQMRAGMATRSRAVENLFHLTQQRLEFARLGLGEVLSACNEVSRCVMRGLERKTEAAIEELADKRLLAQPGAIVPCKESIGKAVVARAERQRDGASASLPQAWSGRSARRGWGAKFVPLDQTACQENVDVVVQARSARTQEPRKRAHIDPGGRAYRLKKAQPQRRANRLPERVIGRRLRNTVRRAAAARWTSVDGVGSIPRCARTHSASLLLGHDGPLRNTGTTPR